MFGVAIENQEPRLVRGFFWSSDMLLKSKEIEFKDIAGFTNDLDIFRRKPIGESLANLLESTEENLIIGVDGQWGEGKSTFARMLSAHLNNERKIPTIYFDAFENDHQRDPFLAIATEVVDLINSQSPELNSEFRISAIRASKAIARGALRIGIKTLTAGILDDSVLDEFGTADDTSGEISQGIDHLLAEKLDQTKTDKIALESFKATLEKHITAIGNEKPVVFIIDELDRCRPDFSLELIEQIKHLFTVKNLKFLLITNKNQIHASIQKRYGTGIEPHIYLQKFIDLWISLPRIETQHSSHTSIYINHLINKITTPEEKIKNRFTLDILKEIFASNKTSYRGIQKTLSYFAILHNTSKDTEYYDYYQAMMAICCYSKTEKPEIISAISRRENAERISALLFPAASTNNREYSREFTKTIIKYLVSDEEKKQEMISNREIQTDFGRGVPDDCIETITNTLSLFSQ
jgi:nucleoside-triphosphatase THEP1